LGLEEGAKEGLVNTTDRDADACHVPQALIVRLDSRLA